MRLTSKICLATSSCSFCKRTRITNNGPGPPGTLAILASSSQASRNPLTESKGIVARVLPFVPNAPFIFLGGVHTLWYSVFDSECKRTRRVDIMASPACLQWALDSGLGTGPDDPSPLLVAARAGTVDCVRLARSAFCLGWGSKCATEAARGGNVNVLEWWRSQDMPLAEACSLDGRTVEAAVASGCVDTVEWCLQRGCEIGAAVETAARLGRIDILKRFNEDDRAATIYTSWSGGPIAAANGGDVATFKGLMEHIEFGDSEDEILSEALSAAAAGGHTELLRHLEGRRGRRVGGCHPNNRHGCSSSKTPQHPLMGDVEWLFLGRKYV
eukprot:jgi/Undpi1/7718/HiC_scaffold_23.g10191.m1